MGKSSYLLLAGILIVGAALSVLAWLAGKGKFSLTAIPKTIHADVADLQTRADLTEGTIVTVTNPVPAVLIRFADL